MSDRGSQRDVPESKTDESPEQTPLPSPSPAPPPSPSPLPRRRRVFGRRYQTRTRINQQWIFVGIALLFLIAYFLGREACARKVADTYKATTGKFQPRRDAGTAKPHPRPRPRPAEDSDGW
ncbi:MAG: hypothetical protein ABI333_24580 [bacterium]